MIVRDDTPTLEGIDRTLHKLSRVIPPSQHLRTLDASTSVASALEEMAQRRFSQVPVVVGAKVVGMFSYSSFARGIASMRPPISLAGMAIEEFLEHDIGFAPASEDVHKVIELLEQHQAVLVGHHERVTAIVTRGDMARYLHSIAEPFMLLEEIEKATRALMELAVSAAEMPELIKVALEGHHHELGKDVHATKLAELTLTELRLVLVHGRNYPRFEGVFHARLETTRGKYEGVPSIRNELLHFRGEWTPERRNVLLTCRGWLERRVQRAGEKNRG